MILTLPRPFLPLASTCMSVVSRAGAFLSRARFDSTPEAVALCHGRVNPTPTFPLFHAGSVPFGPKKSPAPIWVLLHSMAQDWHLQGNFLVICFISYFRVWTSLLALLVLTLCSVAQSCPVVCSPMDCSPPGSSAHEIFQARILEWGAICSSRGIFPTQGSNPHLLHLLHC